MPRTITEKELSRSIREVDFGFVESGHRTLQEVYESVQNEFPNLCNADFLCIDCCSTGGNSPEWKHVVRSLLSSLKKKEFSRVQKIENNIGFWFFAEIIEL